MGEMKSRDIDLQGTFRVQAYWRGEWYTKAELKDKLLSIQHTGDDSEQELRHILNLLRRQVCCQS